MDPKYISVAETDYRALVVKATLGKVLGRNIERAAAFWGLLFSYILVVVEPNNEPLYAPVLRIASLSTWGWIVAVLGSARVVTLIVNGWWPITLQVRIAFSIATLFLVWAGMVALTWMHAAADGIVYPGVVLSPFAATVEVLCFLALRTRLEAERRGINTHVGRSGRSNHRRDGELAAGDRERDSEAALQSYA